MNAIKKGYRAIESVYKAINRICDTLSAIMIVFCILVTVINVIGRLIFKSPMKGAIELIQYTMFTAVCFALAPCNDNKGHIRVDLILEILPKKAVCALEVLVGVISCVGFSICGRYMFEVAAQRAAMGQVLATLKIPVFIFYYIMGVSLIVLALSVLFGIIDSAAGIFKKTEDKPAAEETAE